MDATFLKRLESGEIPEAADVDRMKARQLRNQELSTFAGNMQVLSAPACGG